MMHGFEKSYPAITLWVTTHGWIEIGPDDYSRSFARALDCGGMVWESKGQESYTTMDDALATLEAGLAAWIEEQWGEKLR